MITTITGFLFNRWSFLILAIVIIVALVGAGRLVFNKYTIGSLVLLALGIGLWTWHDKKVEDDRVATAAPYIKLIDDNNKAAEKKLKEETDRVDAANKVLKDFSTQQEAKDHANTQTITALNSKLRNTRLRDPYSQTRCSGSSTQGGNSTNTQSSAGDTPEGSGLLSVEASEFLWGYALESAQINKAYIACRAYAYKVRETLIAETESGGIVLALSEWK